MALWHSGRWAPCHCFVTRWHIRPLWWSHLATSPSVSWGSQSFSLQSTEHRKSGHGKRDVDQAAAGSTASGTAHNPAGLFSPYSHGTGRFNPGSPSDASCYCSQQHWCSEVYGRRPRVCPLFPPPPHLLRDSGRETFSLPNSSFTTQSKWLLDVQCTEENIKSPNSTLYFIDTALRTSPGTQGRKSIRRIWPDIKSAGIWYTRLKGDRTAKISKQSGVTH